MHSFRRYSTQILHLFFHLRKPFIIDIFPPGRISGAPQHFILMMCIHMPTHHLFLSRVCKQTLQMRNYKQVPHILIRGSHLDLIVKLNLSLADILPLCQVCFQIGQAQKSLYASPWCKIQYLIQACIFCTSNPNGETIFFVVALLSRSSLPSGSMPLKMDNIFVNILSDNPLFAVNLYSSSFDINFVCSFL
jgi:hypothetical protein